MSSMLQKNEALQDRLHQEIHRFTQNRVFKLYSL